MQDFHYLIKAGVRPGDTIEVNSGWIPREKFEVVRIGVRVLIAKRKNSGQRWKFTPHDFKDGELVYDKDS